MRTMIIAAPGKTHEIRIDKEMVEHVHKFKYLRTTISEEDGVIGRVNEKIRKQEDSTMS